MRTMFFSLKVSGVCVGQGLCAVTPLQNTDVCYCDAGKQPRNPTWFLGLFQFRMNSLITREVVGLSTCESVHGIYDKRRSTIITNLCRNKPLNQGNKTKRAQRAFCWHRWVSDASHVSRRGILIPGQRSAEFYMQVASIINTGRMI